MNEKAEHLKELRDELITNLTTIIDTIPIFIPANDLDKKILTVGLDMLTSFRTELQNVDTVGGMLRYINQDILEEERWEELQEKVRNINRNEISVNLQSMLDTFRVPEEE